ncbi:MAG: hypothetical protein HOP07_13450 [Bacteriovoracaceae bacterium]|nr:hypothetical protein [Bacteriovoracaceae bacterium]
MSSINLDGNAIPIINPTWVQRVDSPVICIEHSPNDDVLIIGLDDGYILIFNSKTGEFTDKIKAHEKACSSVKFNKNGNCFVSISEDGSFSIFEKNEITKSFIKFSNNKLSERWLEHVSWSQSDDVIICAGKEVWVYITSTKSMIKLGELSSTITGISWINKNEFVVCAYGGLAIFSILTKSLLEKIPYIGSLISVVVSPGEKYIVASAQDKSIMIWEIKTKKSLIMSGFESKSNYLSFHHKGLSMANACGESISVWDYSNKGPAGKMPVELTSLNGAVTDLKFSRNHDYLLCCNESGVLAFWNPSKSLYPLAISGISEHIINVATWNHTDSVAYIGLQKGIIAAIPMLQP